MRQQNPVRLPSLSGGPARLRRAQQFLPAIAAWEPKVQELSETDLHRQSLSLRDRAKSGEPLRKLLPEGFALVREAARRTLGLRHYDVQLLAGAALLLQGGGPGLAIGVMTTAIGPLAFIGLDAASWDFPAADPAAGTGVWLLLAPVAALAAWLASSARSTLTLLVALGFVGLIVALMFLWFSAPDLALTQLMAETLLLFLLAGVLKKTGVQATASPFSGGRALVALAGGALVTMLVLKAMALEWDRPVSDFHLTHSKPAAYGANVVNVILVDFRALDTLGEILVLAIASLGATAALGAARRRSALPFDSDSAWLATAARGLALFALPVSLWLFWRGHNAPGGGFIAALVAASALGLLLLVRHPRLDAKSLRHASLRLSVVGLLIALGSALLPVISGGEFFTGLWWHSGDLHLGTPLLFDLGVYLTVLGFCLGFLRHFQPNATQSPN